MCISLILSNSGPFFSILFCFGCSSPVSIDLSYSLVKYRPILSISRERERRGCSGWREAMGGCDDRMGVFGVVKKCFYFLCKENIILIPQRFSRVSVRKGDALFAHFILLFCGADVLHQFELQISFGASAILKNNTYKTTGLY